MHANDVKTLALPRNYWGTYGSCGFRNLYREKIRDVLEEDQNQAFGYFEPPRWYFFNAYFVSIPLGSNANAF